MHNHDFVNAEKVKYRKLCKSEDTIPVYLRDWWLDAVCEQQTWEVNLIEVDGKIIAAQPYIIKSKFGFKIVGTPLFTPFLGIWLRFPENQNYANKLAQEIEISEKLIAKIPKCDYFNQGFSYEFTNWLGFYWNGYAQTTRYSYVIEDISDIDKVFNGFVKTKKTNIRKAQKIVDVKYDLPAKEFYDFHKTSLGKMGQKISYTFETFNRMHQGAYENNAGRTIYAVDEHSNIHSALYFVWDKKCAYSIISAIDPNYNSSYSLSLLFFEAIRISSLYVNKFDFEGSMIRSVENSYRHFGGVQKPYFKISKINSKWLKFFMKWKS
ncbi:methicillin resistance protein [Solitalea koreensis]|uniref:Acetyltransferase (GNAT) domain-containing protein n=1 Tax=Solitalea koreensis TaxID=543615 RepID=A0A521AN85_9SPHI|nr:methicillin resistance protein [Solitalea koreensis]SMO36294.1 hypothetical protein SAMN06265350_101277 [Solitalea koreensis]